MSAKIWFFRRTCAVLLVFAIAAVTPAYADVGDAAPLAPSSPPKSSPPASIEERLRELWSDVPAYVESLRHRKPEKTQAKLLASYSPESPFPLEDGQRFSVSVAMVVSETGDVENARVLESSDARFEEAAVKGVRKWKFSPALGEAGPMKAFRVVPVVFEGRPAPASRALGIELRGVTYPARNGLTFGPRTNANTHARDAVVSFGLTGPAAHYVKAARAIVTAAHDDKGRVLQPEGEVTFVSATVGSISEEVFSKTVLPDLTCSVAGMEEDAKAVTLEIALEIVTPDVDPNATAEFTELTGKLGTPLISPKLEQTGVTITLFDQPTAETAAKSGAPGGPADFDGGSMFGRLPPGVPAWPDKQVMNATDLALAISDPQQHLVGIEFETASGGALHYNHNGWYHAQVGETKRFSVYRLPGPLTEDVKLVCWLITPKSLVRQTLKIPPVPLPAR